MTAFCNAKRVSPYKAMAHCKRSNGIRYVDKSDAVMRINDRESFYCSFAIEGRVVPTSCRS
jgi:hypothetical protein